MDLKETKSQIEVLIRAKYPLLAIETYEERRIVRLLASIAREQGRDCYCWSLTEGMKNTDGNTLGNSKGNPIAALEEILVAEPTGNGTLYIVKDFHKFMEEPMTTRMLRDLHTKLKGERKTVFLVSPSIEIPKDLQKSITIIEFPLPEREEMEEILVSSVEQIWMKIRDINSHLEIMGNDIDTGVEGADEEYELVHDEMERLTEIYQLLKDQLSERKDKLVQALAGLTYDEAENVVAMCIVRHDLNVATINQEKKQIIKKAGMLEYYEASEDMSSIGGLNNLKTWTKQAVKRFSQEAKDFGLEPPRGILLIGPPGTGKSLSAKAIANTLQVPLLRLDISAISSELYGKSAQNAKYAMSLADATAPCVLWFDEVEKMTASGQGGRDSGHEETGRTQAVLLTHQEEGKAPVFRIGTSNSPFNMRPEAMQRYEVIFFVDAPQKHERVEIFQIQLKEIKRNSDNYDLDQLATKTDKFVGREIRTIVKEALSVAFYEGRELTTQDMLDVAARMTPMLKQKEDDIEKLREWAKSNAIPASSLETPSRKVGRVIEV
jgi:SpoVK/Ycf46/Vps4 family AAA+-type ATPase